MVRKGSFARIFNAGGTMCLYERKYTLRLFVGHFRIVVLCDQPPDIFLCRYPDSCGPLFKVHRIPVVIDLVRGRHMIPDSGVVSRPKASRVLGYTLEVIKDFDCSTVILHFYVMPNITMRYTIIVFIYTQVHVGYLLHFCTPEVPQAIC